MSESDSNSRALVYDDSNSVCDPKNLHVTDGNIGSPEVIAQGISKMVSCVIRDFDSKADDASRSQVKLSTALHRLTTELDQLLEDAPLPFIMQHATKLSNVRKRVSSLNSILRSIQQRLDNIDRMMSIGSLDAKANTGESM
ncbi:unnamed protein product [Amaranthus hypochondriacus]